VAIKASRVQSLGRQQTGKAAGAPCAASCKICHRQAHPRIGCGVLLVSWGATAAHTRPATYLEAQSNVDGRHTVSRPEGHIRAEGDGDAVQQVLAQGALLGVVGGNQQRPAAAVAATTGSRRQPSKLSMRLRVSKRGGGA